MINVDLCLDKKVEVEVKKGEFETRIISSNFNADGAEKYNTRLLQAIEALVDMTGVSRTAALVMAVQVVPTDDELKNGLTEERFNAINDLIA